MLFVRSKFTINWYHFSSVDANISQEKPQEHVFFQPLTTDINSSQPLTSFHILDAAANCTPYIYDPRAHAFVNLPQGFNKYFKKIRTIVTLKDVKKGKSLKSLN